MIIMTDLGLPDKGSLSMLNHSLSSTSTCFACNVTDTSEAAVSRGGGRQRDLPKAPCSTLPGCLLLLNFPLW